MKALRVTGVPEHFNYPFRLLFERQPFLDQGLRIEWKEESRGSGQMNLDLRTGDTDIAILLTESFLKDFEGGNPSKMIGFHVTSPLIWGIHVGADSDIHSLSDLREKKILVSRMGSGSHLMAMVLAKRESWNPGELIYDLVGNMEGAEKAMKEGSQGIFLWEKFTTAPMVEKGSMRRIGEIPSPWPCFVMVATSKALQEFGTIIFQVRDWIYSLIQDFGDPSQLANSIAQNYGLPFSDITTWLSQTQWCTEAVVYRDELERVMATMVDLKLLSRILDLDDFLALDGLVVKSGRGTG